jgi:hypothetical protein
LGRSLNLQFSETGPAARFDWNQTAATGLATRQLENDAMSGDENKYETGGRIFPPASGPDPSDEFSRDAAKNRKPPSGVGLSESPEETNEKTRHSDGQMPTRQATPSPDSQKVGAGPALAEHSKDAKAPRKGRKPGA